MNMLATLRARREDDERGFTLIELMVVVLIIAILIAIAIPTFLGARNRASDRATQSNLRNALTAAKTSFTDNDDYLSACTNAGCTNTPGGLKAVEPSLTYVNVVATGTASNTVSVDINASGNTFAAAAWAKDSNTCFYIEDVSPSGTAYGRDAGQATDGSACVASATAAPAGGWVAKW